MQLVAEARNRYCGLMCHIALGCISDPPLADEKVSAFGFFFYLPLNYKLFQGTMFPTYFAFFPMGLLWSLAFS